MCPFQITEIFQEDLKVKNILSITIIFFYLFLFLFICSLLTLRDSKQLLRCDTATLHLSIPLWSKMNIDRRIYSGRFFFLKNSKAVSQKLLSHEP